MGAKRDKLAGMVAQSERIHGRNLALTMSIRDLRAEIAADEAGADWTAVRDALPDVDEDMGSYSSRNVLVHTAGGETHHAYLVSYPIDDDGDDWGGPRWTLVGRDAYQLDNVTHWRNLPEGPR